MISAFSWALLYVSQSTLILRRLRNANHDSSLGERLTELIDLLNWVRQLLMHMAAGGER